MRQKMLNRKEAAEHIGIAPGTLSNWLSTGRYKIPKYRIGRLVRFRVEDLDKWLERQKEDKIED